MRTSLLCTLLLAAGCVGGPGGTRPGVMPTLSELPADAGKRDAILDQSAQTAGPEHRPGTTVRERQAETSAAFAAAILGQIFSKSSNTTLGTAGTLDENALGPAAPARRARPASGSPEGAGEAEAEAEGEAAPAAPTPPASQLVPWIPLGK